MQREREAFANEQLRKQLEYEDRREREKCEYEDKREKERQERDDFWRKANMQFQAELIKSSTNITLHFL